MSDERERTNNGRYQEEVSIDEVLAQFTDAEPRTASELADELGIARRTAYNKLAELVEDEKLNKKTVGARAVVFWKE